MIPFKVASCVVKNVLIPKNVVTTTETANTSVMPRQRLSVTLIYAIKKVHLWLQNFLWRLSLLFILFLIKNKTKLY